MKWPLEKAPSSRNSGAGWRTASLFNEEKAVKQLVILVSLSVFGFGGEVIA